MNTKFFKPTILSVILAGVFSNGAFAVDTVEAATKKYVDDKVDATKGLLDSQVNEKLGKQEFKTVLKSYSETLLDNLDKTLGQEINTNQQDIIALKEASNINSDNIETLHSDLDKLGDYAEGISDSVANNSERIAKIAEGLVPALEKLQENSSEIEKIKQVQGYADTAKVTEDIGILDDRIDAANDYTEAVDAALVKHELKTESNFEIVNQRLDNTNNIINKITEGLIPTVEQVQSNTSDIEKLKEASNTHADNIEVLDKNIKALGNYAEEISGDVDEVQGQVNKNQEQIEANKSATEANSKAITNKADKTYVDENFMRKANVQDVSALQASVKANRARLDQLDLRVDNLRKETHQGLANSAALAGLFQPYSVGKMNVTAAVGGYKSKTAVAVGTGFRVNENFAVKAGIATGTGSGSSVSYNAGMNFEW